MGIYDRSVRPADDSLFGGASIAKLIQGPSLIELGISGERSRDQHGLYRESLSVSYLHTQISTAGQAQRESATSTICNTRGATHPADPNWTQAMLRAGGRALRDAVRTTRFRDRDRSHDRQSSELARHINYVLLNSFRTSRVRGTTPPRVETPVSSLAAFADCEIAVNGVDRSAKAIDSDPDVYGLATWVQDSLVTVVIPRDVFKQLDLRLALHNDPDSRV